MRVWALAKASAWDKDERPMTSEYAKMVQSPGIATATGGPMRLPQLRLCPGDKRLQCGSPVIRLNHLRWVPSPRTPCKAGRKREGPSHGARSSSASYADRTAATVRPLASQCTAVLACIVVSENVADVSDHLRPSVRLRLALWSSGNMADVLGVTVYCFDLNLVM